MFRKKDSEKEVFGVDEALAKISLELLDPTEQKLMTVSDLTPKEIFSLATLLCYADEFGCKTIKKWIKNFLLLRISRYRLGRREFMFLGSGLHETGTDKKGKKTLGDLFSGLK